MFPFPTFMPASNPTAIEAIQAAGLTSGLKLCLDTGDAASYTSGQSWLDRSGNGYDFFRGATGSAEGSDPTFNGTPGGLSLNEYFSMDGGDYFKYDSANEAWMNNLHKNNAKFSFMTFSRPTGAAGGGFFGTNRGSSATVGLFLYWNVTVKTPIMYVSKGISGTPSMQKTGDTAISSDNWHCVGLTVDEAVGAGGGFMYLDGNYNQVSGSNTFDATYTSPSASNATDTLELCALGNAAGPFASGHRTAINLFWEGVVLTKAQMDSIFTILRSRFAI